MSAPMHETGQNGIGGVSGEGLTKQPALPSLLDAAGLLNGRPRLERCILIWWGSDAVNGGPGQG